MANVYLNLPLPAGAGPGPAVDASALGRNKTIEVKGGFQGSDGRGPSVTIEVSVDGGATFAPIETFTQPGKSVKEVAAQFMRVFVGGLGGAAGANVDVSSDDIGAQFATLPVPAGNGVGASVDVSELGTFNTVTVDGIYSGTISIEISADGTDYAECLTFSQGQPIKSKEFTARFMRVRRSGIDILGPGSASVAVGAINDPGGRDVLVAVTEDDTTPDFLREKIVDGSGITTSIVDPGGDEKLRFDAASVAAVPSNCLIYRQGAADTGPVVYGDWTELYAQLQSLRAMQNNDGCYIIVFDASVTNPMSIPAGTYDMRGVTWSSPTNIDGTSFNDVHLPEGVVLQNLRSFKSESGGTIRLESTATAVSPIADIAGGDLVDSDGWGFQATGGVALFDLSNVGAGQIAAISLKNGAFGVGGGGTNPAVFAPTAGSIIVMILRAASFIDTDQLDFAAGVLQFQQNLFQDNFVFPQPNDLSTRIYGQNINNRLHVRPAPPSAPSAGPISGSDGEFRYDAAAGAIAQSVALAASDLIPGAQAVFKEVSGANPVTLTPSGADTLDEGRIASVIVPAGGAARLVSNGIDNWDVIGMFAPAGGGVFGEAYQSATNSTRQTTTGGGFATHTQLITPALTGIYRIIATALVDVNSGQQMQSRLQNVTDSVQVGDQAVFSSTVFSDRDAVAWSGEVVFAGASKTFELQYRPTPPGAFVTAGMSGAHIALWRVG